MVQVRTITAFQKELHLSLDLSLMALLLATNPFPLINSLSRSSPCHVPKSKSPGICMQTQRAALTENIPVINENLACSKAAAQPKLLQGCSMADGLRASPTASKDHQVGDSPETSAKSLCASSVRSVALWCDR